MPFDESQPREPAGSAEGGQWTSGDAGSAIRAAASDNNNIKLTGVLTSTIKNSGYDHTDVKINDEDILKISGIDGDIKKFDIKQFPDFINVDLKSNKAEIDFNLLKDKTIIVRMMAVYDPGKGEGTKMVNRMITNAGKMGFKEIKMFATREMDGIKYNGYYTFAKLGFEMYKPDEISKLKSLFKVDTLKGLMSSDTGRKDWKNFGFNYSGKLKL